MRTPGWGRGPNPTLARRVLLGFRAVHDSDQSSTLPHRRDDLVGCLHGFYIARALADALEKEGIKHSLARIVPILERPERKRVQPGGSLANTIKMRGLSALCTKSS